ncbi:MAG: DUF1015 family protein [Verrucomicrobiota bacterium]|nr:DUF1015 family protein [Verrucomicrobiota bacterium]
MAIFKPFRAYRPHKQFSKSVASRPYDVLNSSEAKLEAQDNPHSFLHVIKPEIGLPDDVDPYSSEVYEKGASVFEQMKSDKIFFQDPEPYYYLYRLTMNERTQTGVVGCCHYEEYYSGKIKKHELTRTAKENDRVQHVDSLNANAEPVFFSYRSNEEIDQFLEEILLETPEYNFVADDEIKHELWVVKDPDQISTLEELFKKIPTLYVADGHHRTAAAARVGQNRKMNNLSHTGAEEYNLFMAVLFSDQELKIYDYNRVVMDLNGISDDEFLEKLKEKFVFNKSSSEPLRPLAKGDFSVYLNHTWHSFSFNPEESLSDPIANLDVSKLSDFLLEPVLNIVDQRNDHRIDFVGGIRGLEELEKRVDSGEMAVAFALYPVTMEELLSVADAGEIMPPKSTWFEPKLRSGLFVHEL